MRVLLTADSVGGVWNYSLTLARALRNFGVECVLAIMGPAPDPHACPDLEIHHRPYKLEWMDDPWRDVEDAGEWLFALARQHRAALVHLNGYCHAALDFGVPKIVVAHSCVCSWWRAVHREPAPGAWNEYRRQVRAGLDAADLVIAPTKAMLHALEREHGPVARSRIVENAAPGGGIQPSPSAHRDEIVFAAARYDDQAKNSALLEQIAPQVLWPIAAAGDRINGRVPHGEVLRRMSRAAIFCHPALYEPFGLAPLEAALSGCALAMADIPSLRELWSGAAAFFNPRDSESAAATLNHLIANARLRRDLASAALARARRFNPTAQAQQYFDIYRAVITSSGRETALSRAWLT